MKIDVTADEGAASVLQLLLKLHKLKLKLKLHKLERRLCAAAATARVLQFLLKIHKLKLKMTLHQRERLPCAAASVVAAGAADAAVGAGRRVRLLRLLGGLRPVGQSSAGGEASWISPLQMVGSFYSIPRFW